MPWGPVSTPPPPAVTGGGGAQGGKGGQHRACTEGRRRQPSPSWPSGPLPDHVAHRPRPLSSPLCCLLPGPVSPRLVSPPGCSGEKETRWSRLIWIRQNQVWSPASTPGASGLHSPPQPISGSELGIDGSRCPLLQPPQSTAALHSPTRTDLAVSLMALSGDHLWVHTQPFPGGSDGLMLAFPFTVSGILFKGGL